METKGLNLIILGIVAVIAVVGLVLLFKTAMSGEVVRSIYPGGVLQTSSPGQDITVPIETPAFGEYFSSGGSEGTGMTYADTFACDRIAGRGQVRVDQTFEVTSEAEMMKRGKLYCSKAPASIAPVEYCCVPPKPLPNRY